MSAVKKGNYSESSFSFSSVIRGTVVGLVISVLGAAVLGLVFYFSNLSEQTLPLLGAIILFLSVFTGGVFAAQRAGNRGIYHGLAVGIVFFAVSWILTTLFFPGSAAVWDVARKLLITCAAGGFGGVLGVGLSS